MNFHRSNGKRWLLVVCAVMGIVLSSRAQHRGEPIIFSAPDTDIVTNSAPSLAPSAQELPDFLARAPMQAIPTPPSLQPPPVPPVNRQQSPEEQQELDRQKNWTLLTPAEILNVPTLENTFGLSERNASGDTKNQTVLERYLDRQQRSENAAMSNQAAMFNATDWGLQGQQQKELNSSFAGMKNSFNNYNSFFGAPQNDANQNAMASRPENWQQTIAPPSQTPEQISAAQAEAMEFQKLLQPGLASPAKPSSSPIPTPVAPDSIFSQSASPVGNSFTPVSSGVIMPQGVTPLPSALGGKNPSTTPVTPEWKRKLPPWMTQPSTEKNF